MSDLQQSCQTTTHKEHEAAVGQVDILLSKINYSVTRMEGETFDLLAIRRTEWRMILVGLPTLADDKNFLCSVRNLEIFPIPKIIDKIFTKEIWLSQNHDFNIYSYLGDRKWGAEAVSRPFLSVSEPCRRFVYFILNPSSNTVKIGQSKDANRRFCEIQANTIDQLRLMKVVEIEGFHTEEQVLHKRFSHLRIKGEWFSYTDDLKSFIEEVK